MKHWRHLFVWVLAVGWTAASGAETVRVATLNVANYLTADRRVEGVYRNTYPKPESEKAALRGLLRAVNADVIALQEMGIEPFLFELQRDLAREGLDYPYRAWMRGTDTERHLAVLSRLPLSEILVHDDIVFNYFGQPRKVRRGLLEVVVGAGEKRWHLFTLHLKSRWTERDDDPNAAELRVAEAQAVRDRIRQRLELIPDGRMVVAGDFNDTTASRPLARFRQVNGQPLLTMVPCADSRGETWTHFYRREDVYSRADYVFVDPRFLPKVSNQRGQIVDDPAWAAASDHRLVWIDLDLANP